MFNIRFLMTILIACGLISGCGSDDDGGPTFVSPEVDLPVVEPEPEPEPPPEPPPEPQGPQPAGPGPYDGELPLVLDFSVGLDELFLQRSTSGAPPDPEYVTTNNFLAISDNADDPFFKAYSSSSRIFVDTGGDNNVLRFGNAAWAVGKKSYERSTSDTLPDGDIDLSEAYSITFEITSLPNIGGQFTINIDRNTTSGAASSTIYGSGATVANLGTTNPATPDVSGLELGTLVVNVPGDITMNDEIIGEVPVHRGTANSFIGIRCNSGCGNAAETDSVGIGISSIIIDHTGEPFVPGPPSNGLLMLTAGDGTIGVDWESVAGAASYDLAYGTVDDPEDAGATLIEDLTDTEYAIEGLTNGTEYFVILRSKNETGTGVYSEFGEGSVAHSLTPAVAITESPIPTIEAQSLSLAVSWEAIAGAENYSVLYNTVDDFEADEVVVVGNITETTAALNGLTAGIEYFVAVRASNSVGDGPISTSVSGTPLDATVVNPGRTWSQENGEFDEPNYASILTEVPPRDGNNDVVLSDPAVTVNGLNFFVSDGGVGTLRHRGNNNQEFNFNGSAYAAGTSETTPAVGQTAPDQRSYIGVPIEPAVAVNLVVNHRNSSSGVDEAVRIVFIGGTSGNVLCSESAASNVAADTSCSLPEGHEESEIRFIYSRETFSGGLHINAISTEFPVIDRTWSMENGDFDEAKYASVLTTAPEQNENNNVVVTDPAVNVNGLQFFASSAGPLRHRGTDAQEFNFNGTSYADGDATTTPAIGQVAPTQRVYLGVLVVPGAAVDIVVNHRNSSSGTDASVRIVFVGGTTGNVLCAEPASSNVAADTTCSLADGHGESEVRIIYSREGQTGSGMHVNSITRIYPSQ